jgi:hypothetical protein
MLCHRLQDVGDAAFLRGSYRIQTRPVKKDSRPRFPSFSYVGGCCRPRPGFATLSALPPHSTNLCPVSQQSTGEFTQVNALIQAKT